MIASTQLINTETFSFIAVLVFKLLSRKVLLIEIERTIETFKKISNFMDKLLQNYK